MAESQLQQILPTSEQLPCSDDTPVDNEDQNFLPNFLLFLLDFIWSERQDWYFGVDMGIYHTTGVSHLVPVIPDGFLSLGIERRKQGKSRLSYVLWEENYTPPILALEIVSRTPGDEYDRKMEIYANLGVLYYIIYNPEYWRRDGHQPFEVYRLVDGKYQLQIGEPYWMPEVSLGIGRYRRIIGGIERELLYWYDERGNRYLAADEAEQQARLAAEIERQRAEIERQRAERLAARLKELGEDLVDFD
ncbi:MAG TPA: Uma2 family endonuclease [Nostocaceae cyanobacterium]|nr:Uma2 family endonuclease [Nostocaceae cyanobacterium]